MRDIWRKIYGFINDVVRFGFAGPSVGKNSGTNNQLDIRAQDGTSDAIVNVATTHTKKVELEAADGKKTSMTMAVGAATDLDFVFPNTDGNAGDVMVNDGDGNLSWATPAGYLATNDYDLLFGSGSTVNLYNAAAGTFVKEIIIDVTEVFNGTGPKPSVQVGIAGTVDKFTVAADVDLGKIGAYVIDVAQHQVAAAQIIATYTAAGTGGTTGAAKIVTVTSLPA